MPSLSNIFSWSESQQFLLLLLLWAVEPRNRVNWCVLLQTPSKNVYLVAASDWMCCVLQAYSHQRHGMAFWKNSAHCLILCFVCFRHEHRTAVSGESLGRHFELQRKGGRGRGRGGGRGGLGCMILWRPGWAFWGKHFQVNIWTPPFNICPQLWSRSTLYFSRVELFVDEH